MPQHLILRLEAPLMAFGDTMIDAKGPTRDLPNVSTITGLIANALGWTRSMGTEHQNLQVRIVMGTRLDRPGVELRDYQTALLFEDDSGWTTRGQPESRSKSPSYTWGRSGRKELTHQRFRFYRADALVTIALRLDPAEDMPTLSDITAALTTPSRPLFIGRKPCLPSEPLCAGLIDADTVLAALVQWPLQSNRRNKESVAMVIPPRENLGPEKHRAFQVTDRRDWISGVHAGESTLHRLSLPRASFPQLTEGSQ